MSDLNWIIYRIFSKEPRSKVIITGDFNKNDLKEKTMLKYGVKPIIDPSKATHIKGGHLD